MRTHAQIEIGGTNRTMAEGTLYELRRIAEILKVPIETFMAGRPSGNAQRDLDELLSRWNRVGDGGRALLLDLARQLPDKDYN